MTECVLVVRIHVTRTGVDRMVFIERTCWQDGQGLAGRTHVDREDTC